MLGRLTGDITWGYEPHGIEPMSLALGEMQIIRHQLQVSHGILMVAAHDACAHIHSFNNTNEWCQ